MTFSLGTEGDGWNQVAREERNFSNMIRREFFKEMTCRLVGETTNAEFKVLGAIAGRTLRWGQFAEGISLREFRVGIVGRDGEFVGDGGGGVLFQGCHISKEETITRAIRGLEAKGLITRWPPSRREWCAVYMPFPEIWLASHMAVELKGLPIFFDRFVLHQVVASNGGLVRIIEINNDHAVVLPLDNRLHAEGPPRTISWSSSEERLIGLDPASIRSITGG
jgi:hypothetical protein